MTELEEIAQNEVLANGTNAPHFPDSKNLVWDFAWGISHSVTPYEEECTLLRKTIRSSGKDQTLKLKSYHPSIFTKIRSVSGVSDEEFRDEWDPNVVAQNVAAKGAGKSGALFVASKNRKYLLKTLRKEEKDTLRAMASDLLKHFETYAGSFVSRQYILCRIEAQGEKQYFVVFNNLFSTPERTPALKFDLKGAKVNRKSSAAALANPNHVRMDLDETRTFPIEASIREQVIEQINADSDLLARHNVMDYSLLVGVVLKDEAEAIVTEVEESGDEKKKKKKKSKKKKKEDAGEETKEKTETLSSQPGLEKIWQIGLPSASNPNEHYMIGIIDILQDYNAFKKTAHFLKVLIYHTSSGLSTVDADYYSDRFKTYMANNVLVKPE